MADDSDNGTSLLNPIRDRGSYPPPQSPVKIYCDTDPNFSISGKN